ncbi:DNA repair protein RAD5B [Paramyrothecium foliicola]|nr:DNA repair protein RAD5B [Paramyrothecium foliicola]
MHRLPSSEWSQPKRPLEEADDIAHGLLNSQAYSIKRPRSANNLLDGSNVAHSSFPSPTPEIETEICFGMLVNIVIQFDRLHLNPSLTFDESGHGDDTYVHLQLVMEEDRCDIQSKDTSIASMNKRAHASLKALSATPLRFLGLFSRKKIDSEMAISSRTSSTGLSKRTGTMAILVFGPRSIADKVAQDLSRRHLFLQHPYPMCNELPYENPQYLDMVGSSFTNGSVLPPIPLDLSKASANQATDQAGDAIADLASVMENLPNYGYSPDAQIDGRIKTPLLKHQREAVSFISQREAPEAVKPQSLWRIEHNSEAKSLFYKHIITGSKSTAPEDVPGGILADGMGLGKTLTMIASIVTSLIRAEGFSKTVPNYPANGAALVPVQSTLIIVPSTLLLNGWIDEIKKHVVPGSITTYKYHGPNRKLSTVTGLPYHIVLSTYGTVSADFYNGGGVLNEFHWYRLILDEAHTIRNSSTKQYKALGSISASIRWCMTGTVIQNSLEDLASLVRFLHVPVLDDQKNFRRHIIGKKEAIQGISRPDYTNLRLLLRSICFGRNTSSILNDLGVSFVECRPRFSEAERKMYEKLTVSCGESIKAAVNGPSGKKTASRVLTAVLKLRMFCNTGIINPIDTDDDSTGHLEPDEMLSLLEQDGQAICSNCKRPLLDLESDSVVGGPESASALQKNCQRCSEQSSDLNNERAPSTNEPDPPASETTLPIRTLRAEVEQDVGSPVDWTPTSSAYPSKIKALLQDVEEHYSESKCIIFSFWRRSLDLIDKIFSEEGLIFGRVDGQIRPSQRKKVLAQFRDEPSMRILLMTVGTGSVGLNDLSVASRLHILEPQWNPSVESQAIGRVFRLGQKQQVCVIRYIMESTLEESIESRQIVKIQLASKGGLQTSDRENSERERRVTYLRALGRIIEPTAAARKVHGVRNIPSTSNLDSAAQLLSSLLNGYPVCDIRVFSLASSLRVYENPRSKIATVMFRVLPSIVQLNKNADEWHIAAAASASGVVILDTHFMGMTPLNDVSPAGHHHDCIAISGLASHPFGSWQPKGPDKSFMWIRDDLPLHMPRTRALLYGYNTRLHDSNSFQNIGDLAIELINQLQACGYHLPSSKPLAFLAHSLGGLVLREALVQLAGSQNVVYKALTQTIQGVLFFGVPNLGMEQAHFRAIVQNNPNEALVDDMARNSNYLPRLNESFNEGPCKGKFHYFWAYETSESPTVTRDASGKVDRNGPLAILVSRESATCRLNDTDPSVTFPINATHSDMVKFTRDSHYYHIVISKLSEILSLLESEEIAANVIPSPGVEQPALAAASNEGPIEPTSQASTLVPLQTFPGQHKRSLASEVERFKRDAILTVAEEESFNDASFFTVQLFLRELQAEQAKNGSLIHLKRLEPILNSTQQLEESFDSFNVLVDTPLAMGFIWGPLKLILATTSSVPSAFHFVLDAYQDVGLQVPLFRTLQPILGTNPHLVQGLFMIYRDILEFQQGIIRQLKHPHWQQLFTASWRNFTDNVGHIKLNISRSKRMIESQASIAEFEAVNNSRIAAINTFHREKAAQDAHRRTAVLQWLSPFDNNREHERLQKIRSVCKDPGQWLLNDRRFQAWFDTQNQSTPLLWLSGIPGAGEYRGNETENIDAVRDVPTAEVLFFYCRHKDESRNTFTSVARSLLVQMLTQKPNLLSHLHEKAALDTNVLLKSAPVAKELLKLGFGCYDQLYIVLDGLDECEQEDRREIAVWFQSTLENLYSTERCTVRCLFVSQNDGIAGSDFKNIPAIHIQDENREDVKNFSIVWHRKIEQKFGKLESKNHHISQIISAKAQGMFIFAELFAKYLENQVSRADLLEELEPTKLPVKLDHVYERILARILNSRSGRALDHIREILGWLVCAKRPLRWREIQGAVCIDLENQCLNYDREMSDSPKGLFASLVELRTDGTVQLVHETARRYLLSEGLIKTAEADYSLSMLSIAYLSFPHMSVQRTEKDIESDLLQGIYAFYDYASACWAMHLQTGLPALEDKEKLTDLCETLETFLELHWSQKYKPLPDVKRIQKLLEPLQSSSVYEKIVQSVAWNKRQGSKQGQGPNPDEALDLSELTRESRAMFENMLGPSLSQIKARELQRFYGENWFKCPRINCSRYYHGFMSAIDRDQHVNKHERPFLCIVVGCHVEVFGCSTESEREKHLLDYHGIDMYDNTNDAEFPEPHKEKSSRNTAKSDATFLCHLCDKKKQAVFCSVCDERFTRKADCARHERGHGEKKFKCQGDLKNGGSWGCGAAFGRLDKLADHLRSKTGQKCIRPHLLQQLEERRTNALSADDANMFADETGEYAKTLQAAGKMLPSFRQFLRLSGIDETDEGARALLSAGEA